MQIQFINIQILNVEDLLVFNAEVFFVLFFLFPLFSKYVTLTYLLLFDFNLRAGCNLENLGSIWYWLKRKPFSKKNTKSFNTTYSIPFLSVLHQNKPFHNFHKRAVSNWPCLGLKSKGKFKRDALKGFLTLYLLFWQLMEQVRSWLKSHIG